MKIKIKCGDCYKPLKQDGAFVGDSETELIMFVKPHYCKGAVVKYGIEGKKEENHDESNVS